MDIGAVAERIQQHKFGWVVNVNSTNKDILNKIVEICENVEEYKIKIDNLNKYNIKSINEMTDEYIILYKKDLAKFDAQSLRELIAYCQEARNIGYNPQLDEILNSRRWKLVSRIQLPEVLKKVSRKIIK